MQVLQSLSNESLIKIVPAIGAQHAAERTSSIYKQVRTIEVVDILRDQGWMPVRARSINVRSQERGLFCKHEIRFQRENDRSLSAVGDESVQMILTNSHDAGSCYHVMLGVFRLACSNGMVVQSASFQDIRVRHVGFDPQEIVRASAQVGEAGKMLGDRVNAMRNVRLLPEEQTAMADSAAMLLFDPEDIETHRVEIQSRLLNRARRYADNGNDLWRTFNRIQENVVKGGVPFYRQDQENGRYAGTEGAPVGARFAKARLHQIKSIDRDIQLNKALWVLAEKMLKLKTK